MKFKRFLIGLGIALILIVIVALSFLLNSAIVYAFGILPFLIAISVLELAILIVITCSVFKRMKRRFNRYNAPYYSQCSREYNYNDDIIY